MKVTIRASHCSNTFGVRDNLHITEFSAMLGDPCPQRIMLFVAILNPTAFTIIQNEANDGIHGNGMQVPMRTSSLNEAEATAISSA